MLDVTQQPRQLLFTWPGWRLEFEWHQDRWQHALAQATSGGWQRQLISIEGNSDDAWPASPAFQYAQVERLNASTAEVQLLGQAGRNHYSGAIRCDAEQQMIDFDLAVRIQSPPPSPLLLSSYKVVGDRERSQHPQNWDLSIEALPEQPACSIDWTSDSLVCVKIPDLGMLQASKPRATLRWKYQWRLKPIA